MEKSWMKARTRSHLCSILAMIDGVWWSFVLVEWYFHEMQTGFLFPSMEDWGMDYGLDSVRPSLCHSQFLSFCCLPVLDRTWGSDGFWLCGPGFGISTWLPRIVPPPGQQGPELHIQYHRRCWGKFDESLGNDVFYISSIHNMTLISPPECHQQAKKSQIFKQQCVILYAAHFIHQKTITNQTNEANK